MYYIGSKDVLSVEAKGYKGSVSSVQYKSIWKSELKSNPHLFSTRIVSVYTTRAEAYAREEELQRFFNVVKNPMYINAAIANANFGKGLDKDQIAKMVETKRKNGKRWTRSLECRRAQSIRQQGEGNHQYGKTKSEEQKQYLRSITLGIKRSEEHKAAHRGSNNPKACPVNIGGIQYGCKKDAREALGMSVYALNKLIKEN
jgi:hypothetical protein